MTNCNRRGVIGMMTVFDSAQTDISAPLRLTYRLRSGCLLDLDWYKTRLRRSFRCGQDDGLVVGVSLNGIFLERDEIKGLAGFRSLEIRDDKF